ncbi:MAG: glycosyltransferase [Anaerolineae bacterium]|nr:glycosyltransferase [Anaerolineae bacterium]
MRIAIVVHGFPPTYYAGAERAAERIVHWLVAQHHEVEVFALEQLNAAETRLETRQENGFIVHRFYYNVEHGDPFRNLYDHPAIGAAFRTFLEGRSFDLVHIVSGYLLGGQVIHVARAQGIPVVMTLTEYWFLCYRLNLLRTNGDLCVGPETDEKCARCLLEEKRRYRMPVEFVPREVVDRFWSVADHTPLVKTAAERIAERRQTLRQALDAVDLVISPSRFLIDKFHQFGFDTRNYVYIRHGLTVQHRPASHQSPDSQNALRLGYIGQIKAHKGTDLLVDALLPLIERGEKVTLDVWGPEDETPDYAAELKRRTAGTPAVRWHGRYQAPQVWDILSSFDLLVVPSRWYENSPTVIAEAFTIGLPVIATNLGGMAELVTHEQSGLLFELNSITDLRGQIERLLHEPDLLGRLQAGVPAVKTAEDEVQEIFAQYQRLVGPAS